MARKSTNMRYVKDIIRLKHQNQLSVREIAGSCGLPASTVGDYARVRIMRSPVDSLKKDTEGF